MHLRTFCLVVITLSSSLATSRPGYAQRFEKEIPLAGVEGRIDHLSMDVEGQRLFVSALGNDSVEVIDLRSGERIHSIPGLKEPQGSLYDPDAKRLYVGSGGDGTLRSYDGQSFAPLGTANLGDDADNVRYDSQTKRIVVGFGGGGLATFDTNLKMISNVKLPVHPESFQLEKEGARAFVNLPDDSSIGVVDRKRNELSDRWHVSAALANFPMALDENHKRLFVGCRKPARLLVLDTGSGKLVAELPTVSDTDDLFYDAARNRIYVIGGEGYIDVYKQENADQYQHISRIATSAGARTGLFVPAFSHLFVAAPRRGSKPARILVYRVD
jgi:DNA-binding beta-propeller fold protein YncE